MNAVLDVEDLWAGYSGWPVLQGVNFRAEERMLTGIIGPNGCGKSTLFKSVVGLVSASQGSVRFRDADITSTPPFETLSLGLAYIPQGTQVFANMTVEENLLIAAHTVTDPQVARGRFEEIYEHHFPFLRDRRRQVAGTLSGGEQSMLSFAMALVLEPSCVLLDEPSLGLAPQMLHQVYETVVELNEQGLTFVIIEQNVRALLEVVDHVVILDDGKIRYDGTPRHLEEEGELMNLYVGFAGSGQSG